MPKVQPLLLTLKDDQLYTSGAIVNLAQTHGLISGRRGRFQWQLTLNWLALSRDFPQAGDGATPGAETPAWYGRRWKLGLPEDAESSTTPGDQPYSEDAQKGRMR